MDETKSEKTSKRFMTVQKIQCGDSIEVAKRTRKRLENDLLDAEGRFPDDIRLRIRLRKATGKFELVVKELEA